jgi:hypothetical protein
MAGPCQRHSSSGIPGMSLPRSCQESFAASTVVCVHMMCDWTFHVRKYCDCARSRHAPQHRDPSHICICLSQLWQAAFTKRLPDIHSHHEPRSLSTHPHIYLSKNNICTHTCLKSIEDHLCVADPRRRTDIRRCIALRRPHEHGTDSGQR